MTVKTNVESLNMMTLAQARRARLAAAMATRGIDVMVLYGNAWQGDYLRYAADFGILEGHGIALVSVDGAVELFLDSATEAERAEIVTAAQSAWEAAHFASAEDDNEVWKELFGPRFRIEDAA